MRARICPNRRAVKWLSASCRTKCRACRDQAPTGLEQPPLQARQRPTLNGKGESEPTQEVAEISVPKLFWYGRKYGRYDW
jgi:hypothetical protein